MQEPYTKVTKSEIVAVFREWLRMYDTDEAIARPDMSYEDDAAHVFLHILAKVRSGL
jgi:hypothetical protein